MNSMSDLGMPVGDMTPLVPEIKHVVLIVQENHTFDAHFGLYCLAPTGSNPTCNIGPACCEKAPSVDPANTPYTSLTDSENGSYDPDHTQACELPEADNGKMDKYTTGVSGCSDPRNFALSDPNVVEPYHEYASEYALADRYFQPLSGQSSSNDMYFAVAQFVFQDNAVKPDASGQGCWFYKLYATVMNYVGVTTIADLLIQKGLTFSTYAMGFSDMYNATLCPGAPADCTSTIGTDVPNPCWYDASDFPFQYYAQFTDNIKGGYMKDYTQFAQDVAAGQLPTFSYVKGSSYKDEHPGYGTTISYGVTVVQQTVNAVMNTAYANDTLILLTWDEGGGFFDHIAPPGLGPVDNQPYGTRVPMLAIGKFARQNYVSHVQMEHSSVVKFLEYNFLGATGQLKGRDTVVNNIGSLLDPSQTGIIIPEN
jgi:phospholipase C